MVTDNRADLNLPILERRSETRALRTVIASVRAGNGRLVAIEGEAGIGKSSLLRLAVAMARHAGVQSLVATGSELERQYPFGVAVALLEPLVHGRSAPPHHLLDGPAAVTAPLFGLDRPSAAPAGDRFATIHGLYWLTLNATDRGPLLLAIDEAQWADEATLHFVYYLARRIRELPVAVVIALRTGEGASEDEVGRLLRSDRDAIHLRPASLSEEAVGKLVAASGERAADPRLRRACWEASGGNPFLATGLAWELWRGSLGQDDLPLDPSSLIPDRVMRFVEARFSHLDGRAQRVAEAVAVLGEAATVERVVRLVRIPEEDVVEDARTLVRVAILRESGTLGFVHPLVRHAVYEAFPAVSRKRAHRDAARILVADGAPIGTIAGHLLESEPSGDAEVVTALLEAGRDAAARGQPEAATQLLRRALEEPPAGDRRREVLLELARAEAAAGSPSSITRFADALDLTPDRRERAALLLELGHSRIRGSDHAAAAEAFKRGMEELGDPSDEVGARLEAGFVAAGWLAAGHREAAGRIGLRILSQDVLGPAHRELAMAMTFERSITGAATCAEALRTVHRVLDEAPVEVLIGEGQLIELATGALFSTDELVEHGALAADAIAAARAQEAYGKIGVYSAAKSWSDYQRGRLIEAIAGTETAIRAADLGWEALLPFASGVRGMALIERGDLAAAERALDLDPDRWSGRADWLLVLLARGRLHDAAGDTDSALAAWREVDMFGNRLGYRSPGPPEWRGWMAEALARRGERDEARRVAGECVEIARHWGARWPLAHALRSAGIVEGGPRGLELLREAASMLENSPALLERTRALVDLGAALRRQGPAGEAREVLTAGMELAHEIGALALLARSRDELLAAGYRPRRYARRGVDALTPSESRVARLAANGRTNRQIAEALFVTPKAVEFHLANAYRKLGIASRRELPGSMAAAPD